jgi:peptidoglycan-N-acetylglucosamine deacetylase
MHGLDAGRHLDQRLGRCKVNRARMVAAATILIIVAGLGSPAMTEAGSPTPAQDPLATVVSHGSRAANEIALTFDDGVSPANCRRILAILVGESVPATFFPLAEAMRLDPAFWRLVGEAGDPVGNHSLTHPQMPGLDLAGQIRQIALARTLEESILGRPVLDVFRPPYGAFDAATLAAAAETGFPTVLTWDQSDRDTSPTGHEPAMLAAAELGGNGSVILLHCGPNATPWLLGPLIEFYRNRGFRFVTIPEMFGIPWDAGLRSRISPATILAGLSALPASPSGGPITGPNGWVAPVGSSPPVVPVSVRSPAPARSPATPAGAAASGSARSSGSPLSEGPIAAQAPGQGDEPLALAGLAGLVLLGLGLLAIAARLFARSRRPRS